MAKGNSKAKKIIISAVAVFLAAAVIVTGYFVWYKPNHMGGTEFGGGSDSKKSVKITPASVSYETAQYKGGKVPAAFVEILEQAEKDSEKACKKHGVAMTVGSNNISATEYAMTYFDVFIYLYNGEITDPQGLYPEDTAAPSKQAYGDSGQTWADRVNHETANLLHKRYVLFEEALENGFLLSDAAAGELADFYESVKTKAGEKGISPDEEIAGSYFDGATLGLCARNLILRSYASEYEALVRNTMYNSHSDSEVKGIYEKNPSKYNYVDVRVFEMPADDSEAAALAKKEVKDLDSFFKFGRDYFKEKLPNYDKIQETETRKHFAKYEDLVVKFDEQVADWCFADGRKAGDVDVIKGEKFNRLIYVEKPQYTLDSVNFHECITYFNDMLQPSKNDEEDKNAKLSADQQLEYFKQGGGTVEAFENVAEIYNESYESYATKGKRERVFPSSSEYVVEKWLYSPERKKGDYGIFRISIGYGLYVFDGLNEGDLDAYEQIRNQLVEMEYGSYYESVLNYNGNKATVFDSVAGKAADRGEEACARYAEKRAELKSNA